MTNNEGRYNMGIKITTAVKTRPLDGITNTTDRRDKAWQQYKWKHC